MEITAAQNSISTISTIYGISTICTRSAAKNGIAVAENSIAAANIATHDRHTIAAQQENCEKICLQI